MSDKPTYNLPAGAPKPGEEGDFSKPESRSNVSDGGTWGRAIGQHEGDVKDQQTGSADEEKPSRSGARSGAKK